MKKELDHIHEAILDYLLEVEPLMKGSPIPARALIVRLNKDRGWSKETIFMRLMELVEMELIERIEMSEGMGVRLRG